MKNMDDVIFNAICDWKVSHRGSDPTLEDLAQIVGRGKTTVRYHIKQMIESGRIRTDEYCKGFDVGGRWIPPGDPLLKIIQVYEETP